MFHDEKGMDQDEPKPHYYYLPPFFFLPLFFCKSFPFTCCVCFKIKIKTKSPWRWPSNFLVGVLVSSFVSRARDLYGLMAERMDDQLSVEREKTNKYDGGECLMRSTIHLIIFFLLNFLMMKDGAGWSMDPCTQCSCSKGEVRCAVQQCPVYQPKDHQRRRNKQHKMANAGHLRSSSVHSKSSSSSFQSVVSGSAANNVQPTGAAGQPCPPGRHPVKEPGQCCPKCVEGIEI